MFSQIRKFRKRTFALASLAALAANGSVSTPVSPAPIAPASLARPGGGAVAKVPPGPPDGTYVYAIARNGTDQGKTTITIFRRDDAGELETDETGYAGAARAQILASYRYADLTNDSYVATYRAPFLKDSPFGALLGARSALAAASAPITVRYRVAGLSAKATVDGVARSRDWQLPAGAPKPQARTRWILDAPFMTGAMLVPVYRHRSGDADLAPISAAFDEGVDVAPERVVADAPRYQKTPKTDVALQIQGVATLWYDRGNWIVDEAHFDGLNLDAHLLSYSRAPLAPAPPPDVAPSPRPNLVSRAFAFPSEDASNVAGLLDLPASGKPRAPALIFVPPLPDASINYRGDGPDPMYPNLAAAFAARGYAIVRYPGREVAKNAPPSTWKESIDDIQGALSAAASDDAIDPTRIYLLGYGIGADLALTVAGAPDVRLAGVVALGPTVIAYRECAERAHLPQSAFFKSASAHDPVALAQRGRVPIFMLHPGRPICGETKDETSDYDDKLRAVNARATIVAASDLSARFGGLYDADSTLDTEEFFPYHFDPSTRDAIGDWLDNPKADTAGTGVAPISHGSRPPTPPPPPPVSNTDMNGEMPNPHMSPTERAVEPGVVLPSGLTPPPYEPEPSPSPAASSEPTAQTSPSPAAEPSPSPAVQPSPVPAAAPTPAPPTPRAS
jgi:dienelactone hydrolase